MINPLFDDPMETNQNDEGKHVVFRSIDHDSIKSGRKEGPNRGFSVGARDRKIDGRDDVVLGPHHLYIFDVATRTSTMYVCQGAWNN